MTPSRLLFVGLILVVCGCARSVAGGTAAGRQNVLTSEEITASGVTNMHDAIARLRPQYLRGRGQTTVTQGADRVQVYVDRMHYGGEESLRTIAANGVQRVEFVSGGDSAFRFGTYHPAGVIHVVLR